MNHYGLVYASLLITHGRGEDCRFSPKSVRESTNAELYPEQRTATESYSRSSTKEEHAYKAQLRTNPRVHLSNGATSRIWIVYNFSLLIEKKKKSIYARFDNPYLSLRLRWIFKTLITP